MPLPVVAIVGRPNVGKSALFNRLVGRRISIVDPTAGVTRDRVSTPMEVDGQYFELVDTGGMGIQDHDNLTAEVERQIDYALNAATVILFTVDVREGIVPLDQMVAERLRALASRVVFVANKSDDPKFDGAVVEFYRLGFGAPIPVSANNDRGQEELLAAILAKIPKDADNTTPAETELKVAIVGKRNVGKSTFINSLASDDRVIVSEIPGTTRDSVDVRFERDGKTFVAIDTAGVRKRKSVSGNIEFYSLHRAQRSIRRADVVLLFFDSLLKIGRVDKQLAEYIFDLHKPSIFVINKWDLAKDSMETERMGTYVRKVFPMLDFTPIAFTTAKDGKNVFRTLNLAQSLHKAAGRRVSTGVLNRIFRDAIEANPPPLRSNKQGRIYYASQIATHPPTVAMVTNGPELFDDTYMRYLTKSLRDNSPFGEVPIKMILRAKSDGAGGRVEEPEDVEVKEIAVPVKPRKKRVETPEPVAEVAVSPKAPKTRPRSQKKKKTGAKTWDL